MTTATLKYMFSLRASLPKRMLGKTPAGHRFDVEYRATSETQNAGSVTTDPIRLLADWARDLFDWVNKDPARLAGIIALDKAGQYSSVWKTLGQVVFGGVAEDEVAALVGGGQPPPYPGNSAELEALLKDVTTRLESNGSQDLKDAAKRLEERRKAALDYEQLVARADQVLDLVRAYCAEHGVRQPWLGLKGHIISGVDWALLRGDGVIEFDGQITLSDGPADDKKGVGVLVNARTSGAVDLVGKDEARPLSLDHALERWMASDANVPIALNVRFEAPQEPEPWASKKYTRRKGQLRYAALSRGQFVGCGAIKTNKQNAASIKLDLFQVVPNLELEVFEKKLHVPASPDEVHTRVLRALRTGSAE
jgi:hypothetical protein